jgi:hypothetical protein
MARTGAAAEAVVTLFTEKNLDWDILPGLFLFNVRNSKFEVLSLKFQVCSLGSLQGSFRF